MSRKRTSVIWKIDRESLTNIVKSSNTITKILNHFKLRNVGGNHRTLKEKLSFEKIDYLHIKDGRNCNAGRIIGPKLTKEQALEKYFKVTDKLEKFTSSVKRYLKRDAHIPYQCVCGNTGFHENKPLVLQLHHLNGKPHDNRIENLQWLCPNCHSQTNNFAGRPLRKPNVPSRLHDPRPMRRKVQRPSKEILAERIKVTPFTVLGKEYGVSDNAVRKWCKSYQLI